MSGYLLRSNESKNDGLAPVQVCPPSARPGHFDMFLSVHIPDPAKAHRNAILSYFKNFTDNNNISTKAAGWFDIPPVNDNPRDTANHRLAADSLSGQIKCGTETKTSDDFYCYVYDPNNPAKYTRLCYQEYVLCDPNDRPIQYEHPKDVLSELRLILRTPIVV